MKFFEKHKNSWSQKKFVLSTLLAAFLLLISLLVNSYANIYVSSHMGKAVNDIILDSLPVVDVHLIYSEGAILFILALFIILAYEPKYIPFTLKSLALFIIVRSFFMILTHLAPPINGLYINPTDYIQKFSSGDDLFFSAHTGLPFLLSNIFKNKKYLRYFFLACTIIGGATVLLGHLHYSIDVFSAFFIAYGIFSIAQVIFSKDYQLTQ